MGYAERLYIRPSPCSGYKFHECKQIKQKPFYSHEIKFLLVKNNCDKYIHSGKDRLHVYGNKQPICNFYLQFDAR